MNETRAAIYERLMDAQERVADARRKRGVDDAVIRAALDQVDDKLSDDDRHEDLYLAALAHYVRALGGQLEVRATFPDEVIAVRRDPDE